MSFEQLEAMDRKNEQMQAMRSCLDQLVNHAEAQGWVLAANLIGAASRALADELVQREANNGMVIAAEVKSGTPE